ncbi:acyl-CoA dehydrogenase family protein [Hyphobacterium sp. HN65]|uniref:Acyl-CoA dehydrogenase family protein n=1 Tax=Hyphobacterium lacteum TaxID=3116575 RepID=A0ABU7LSB0_9PROT|nr:acyl-CoA dehydrogenase family protein [Hyphobacterium sp. HN65]MEE2526778.1 acyl-CoA dehydrogenase family protein [Hyphobacterium sp. HN65]
MDKIGKLGFSEEQADLLEVAMNFCRDKSPIERVRGLLEDKLGHDPELWKEIGEMGWLGIAIPEAYGGIGLSMAEVVPVAEAMGRYLLNSPFTATTLAAQALLAGGTEAQKQAWLPRLAGGEAATLALLEAEGDWDVMAISARAGRDGDTLELSGRKRFVADAASASAVIVSVQLDGQPTLVLLEAADLGREALRPETIIDETRRTFELTLDGIRISEDRLLDPDLAATALKHIHLCSNLLAAADMTGGNLSVIDYTLDYLRTRTQFGKPIGSYQALKHPMVDAYVMYEQARSHVYSAAHCFNQQGEGEIATRMAKVTALEAYSYAGDRSIQFHGGFGFTYDCDAQLYRRRAIWHGAMSGDSAFHKKALADLLLG